MSISRHSTLPVKAFQICCVPEFLPIVDNESILIDLVVDAKQDCLQAKDWGSKICMCVVGLSIRNFAPDCCAAQVNNNGGCSIYWSTHSGPKFSSKPQA